MSSSSPLMVSISGIRGIVGSSFTPAVVVRYVEAFCAHHAGEHVVLGRDSRVSGPWVVQLVEATLLACGKRVTNIGLVATPTVQLAVLQLGADGGGIVVTSSHNPVEWNGLKFVAPDSLFVSPEMCAAMYRLDKLPRYATASPHHAVRDDSWNERHVDTILRLPAMQGVRLDGLRIALDTVCGAGGPVMALLLRRLGAEIAVHLHAETSGVFPRPPEPIPEHLTELGAAVRLSNAALGIAVDPDVDRCVVLDELGRPVGEELTLAACVDFVLSRGARGKVIKNMSSSRATDEVCKRYEGCSVSAVPVGEVHVARAMRATGAVIGGEGNGGVLVPELHLGRDAPVAAAFILAWLAGPLAGKTASAAFGVHLPKLFMCKLKAPLVDHFDQVLEIIASEYTAQRDSETVINREDGLRIDTKEGWIHLRASNTEPVYRVIGEWAVSPQHSLDQCNALLEKVAKIAAGLKK